MKALDLYTDGACSGNPGKGGFGAILRYRGVEKRISGYAEQTTNNRMELFAVIAGLRELKEGCDVTIYSDSAYVVNAFENGWLDAWIRNQWKTSSGEDVKNQDLWRLLVMELSRHRYRFVKVKGHADNEYNNACDRLATGEIAKHS